MTEKPALRTLLMILLLAAVVFGGYSSVLSLGLVGQDTYPVILTSRVQSGADFIGNFTEKLMDGRYASDFWRPMLNLTVAWDHALWGLDAFGYQLSNLLIFLACVLSLYGLAHRLGERGWLGPLAGALIFALHPLQIEVIPVVPRRPEVLGCLFTGLAVAAALSPKALSLGRPAWLSGLCALFGVMSKETAVLSVALVGWAVFLRTPATSLAVRLRRACFGAVPALIGAGMAFVFRMTVIGGLGGHQDESVDNFGTRAFLMMKRLLFPQKHTWESTLAVVLGIGFALGLLAWAVISLRAAGRRAAGRDEKRVDSGEDNGDGVGAGAIPYAPILFAFGWVALMIGLHAYVGARAWYFPFMLYGFALLMGCSCARWVAELRTAKNLVERGVAGAALVIGLAIWGWQLSYSGVFYRYPEWPLAEEARAGFIEQLDGYVQQVPEGQVARIGPIDLPVIVSGWRLEDYNEPMLYGASILRTYSVQAWVDMRYPDREITIVGTDSRQRPPRNPAPSSLELYLFETYVYPR